MNEFTQDRRRSTPAVDCLAPIYRRSMFWTPDRRAASAWVEHVPFAFWLVEVLSPGTIVELGTQHGVSYSAMCQAVKVLGLSTRCFAVDTWKGDEHVGFYGEDVYREFAAFHDHRYGAFSRLIRSSFEEAVAHFEDGSIDLLHVDGLHTYEAVRHDFETWQPKLSQRAIVMFHDVNVREHSFGVFRLWDEVSAGQPSFLFLHGHGLGILGVGANYPRAIELLFAAPDNMVVSIREVFASLGRSARLATGVAESELEGPQNARAERDQEIARILAELDERKSTTAALERALAAQDQEVAKLARELTEARSRAAGLDQALAERNIKVARFDTLLQERESTSASLQTRLSALEASTSWQVTAPLRAMKTLLLRLFTKSPVGLLPPITAEGITPRAQFVQSSGAGPGLPSAVDSVEPYSVTRYLSLPADEGLVGLSPVVTRFMHYIWQSRPDLKRLFDLRNQASRLDFCKWFLFEASREYGLPPEAYPDELLVDLFSCGGVVAEQARSLLDDKNKLTPRAAVGAGHSRASPGVQERAFADGVNLVGYFRGEFGLGQLSRTAARAFDGAHVPFSLIDHSVSGRHGLADSSVEQWISDTQPFRVNLLAINADILPSLYFKLGDSFFSGHYNIGYWAWELPKVPPQFDLALTMVDEVWGISEFVARSIQSRSPVPVLNMPPAVSTTVLRRHYSKKYFGLDENAFYFNFTFDAASYLARKNPLGAVCAFKLAFPRGDEKVGLVLKAMNVPTEDPLWDDLTAEARVDRRITIMDKRLNRDEVIGLNSVCDAFISLHRAEGFGFNLAEAMLLGKPVIATNYSGTREFAREGTACLVNYQLVSVPEEAYPFWPDQVWAEPDVAHAAAMMARLVSDDDYREEIARAGQRFVRRNFSPEAIGTRYATRLAQLKAAQFTPVRTADEVFGVVDRPAPAEAMRPDSGVIEVAGWFASTRGIESVQIYCDGALVGDALYGLLRPDIGQAFPQLPGAERSGFFWSLDCTRLAPGPHRLRVAARSRSGRLREAVTEFTLVETTG